MKKCSHCKNVKPLSEFNMRNRKKPNGEIVLEPNCYCRECNSQRAKDRYYKIKEEGIRFVYRLLDKDNAVVYVGKTESLPTRTNQHFSKQSHLFNKVDIYELRLQYIAMTSTALMDMREIYYINKYKPKYNTIFMNNEPSIIISDFELDEWLDYGKFEDIEIQNKVGISNEFLKLRSVFIRKRGNRFTVYIEVITRESKRKQILRGSFKNEEEAHKLVEIIKSQMKFCK